MHRSRLAGFIIDCQTDDLDGATRCCVMQAPTGQVFCVVRPQRAYFAARANAWHD
jgi:hypothetical protein